MEYDYEGPEQEEWPENLPRDVKIDEAKRELEKFFAGNRDKVYYVKQLEVFFEKRFYHWIVAKAVKELVGDGLLGEEEIALQRGTFVKFLFDKRLRYYKRQINRNIEVIRAYSNPNIAIACGRQAEVLFFNALTGCGFVAKGQNTNEHGDRKWTETENDLDFILGKDGITYGCEVKNKWDYIEKDELAVKLSMSAFLGVKPLFIMRYSPKSYNWEIAQSGGYAMIFEA
ncbi:MAG: hypothetical protein HY670_11485 [Chloroflexi bacterium]|nr:hypothetical protein [Chloroflexota bacterium]